MRKSVNAGKWRKIDLLKAKQRIKCGLTLKHSGMKVFTYLLKISHYIGSEKKIEIFSSA